MTELDQIKHELEEYKKLEMERVEELANVAVHDKQQYMTKHKTFRVAFICLCVVILAMLGCFTYYATSTMKEQQYALNMQFAGMVDLVGRMEVTSTSENISVAEFDDNGNPKAQAENKTGGNS